MATASPTFAVMTPRSASTACYPRSLDRNDEKVMLITPAQGNRPPSLLAWSPDGNRIALSEPTSSKALGSISVFDVNKKQMEQLAAFDDKAINQWKYSPDGSGIIAEYQRAGPNLYRTDWFLPGSGSAVPPITRDTNRYRTLLLRPTERHWRRSRSRRSGTGISFRALVAHRPIACLLHKRNK